MSQQTHLVELEKKHQALENALEDAMAHPSVSDQEVADMKRRKLHLKDEIERLRAEISARRATVH